MSVLGILVLHSFGRETSSFRLVTYLLSSNKACEIYPMTNTQFFTRSPEQFGGKLSFVVTDLIDELKKRDVTNVQGIFRLNGSSRDQEVLSNMLNEGRVSDFSKFDTNTIASTLKGYFRQSINTNPLLPYDELYEPLIIIPSQFPSDIAIPKYQSLFQYLTKPRFELFAYLILFLADIAKNSEVNKMTSSNIAICFAPNIMNKPDVRQDEILELNEKQNKVIQMIIENADVIFDGVDFSNSILTDEEIEVLKTPQIDEADIKTIRETTKIRESSLIPFIPQECLESSNFSFPNGIPPSSKWRTNEWCFVINYIFNKICIFFIKSNLSLFLVPLILTHPRMFNIIIS